MYCFFGPKSNKVSYWIFQSQRFRYCSVFQNVIIVETQYTLKNSLTDIQKVGLEFTYKSVI